MSKFTWRFTNRKAASNARKLGRECEELAASETGHRKDYWMAEATRHFNRAKDYEFHGRTS